MRSLNARLLVVASIVLAAFLGLTGLTLDRGFRDSALLGVHDRLQAAIYMILGAGDLDEIEGLKVREVLPDPRLGMPDSGLYAEVIDSRGALVWRSASTLGRTISFPAAAQAGDMVLKQVDTEDGDSLYAMAFTVAWELSPERVARYTIRAAESDAGFRQQVNRFRRGLWTWFAGVAIVLLVVQAVILRWGLAPLRRVADEVTNIENGRQAELAGPYPRELEPLTQNLNALLRNSRAHLERYRNALADLAHSLKTPLAVLHSTLEGDSHDTQVRATINEQLERLDETVEYQLQRAAASGRTALTAPIRIDSVIRRVTDSLEKVYPDKQITIDCESGIQFHADEGDLIEILGNLADNAAKWAAGQLWVRATQDTESERLGSLRIEIEDDGPGFPEGLLRAGVRRGMRGDTNTAGHGIGLSVVREIVEQVYRGELLLDNAGSNGGARVTARLPA